MPAAARRRAPGPPRLAGPLADAHAEIAPDEAGRPSVAYATNAPSIPGARRDAPARRPAETAEKEFLAGTTLVGPHRDDLVFEQAGRDLATFASRGQQRTAILAFKLAELDLLTALDGRPPLLLLDDVFSELDPERRAHLVRATPPCPRRSGRRRPSRPDVASGVRDELAGRAGKRGRRGATARPSIGGGRGAAGRIDVLPEASR
jgi:hypothetical protein